MSGEVCWGIGGGEGSCEKRNGECGGRCREVCWDVGMSKKRCVGSREVWKSVSGEWGSALA